MNVLHVCSTFESGGIKTFVKSIIELNSTSNTTHDLMVIFGHNNNELQDECNTHYLNYDKRNHIFYLRQVFRICKRYDVFMIHAAHPIVIFALLLIRSKKKCFFFQHGMSASSGSKFKRSIKKLWYSIIPVLMNAKVICSTEVAFRKVKKEGIVLRNKRSKVIPFGVRIDQGNRKKNKVINRHFLRVGMAGHLKLQKRFDLVLRSLLSYTGKTKIDLKIAGDGPELLHLRTIADHIKNVNVKVDFLGSVQDMDAFYHELDVFILPSKYESFGLVVLEALTRSIPVAVFSDVGGCLSLIEDGRTGFILNEGMEGLDSLWTVLARSPDIIDRQKEILSQMDFGKFDIVNTRKELEQLAKTI